MATSRICKVEGCGKRLMAFGWCNKHYQRWKHHGDPLAGGRDQTPRGEPDRFFAETVLTFASDECLTWPYGRISGGYGMIHRGGRAQLVHRLACEAVHGAPPTTEHEAIHSCGGGREACCNPRHVRWGTHTENMADKLADGTHNRGERQGQSKLTENDVQEIRVLHRTVSRYELASKFGVSHATISDIVTGRTWGWLAAP